MKRELPNLTELEPWRQYKEERRTEEQRIREQLAWQFRQSRRARQEELDRMGLSHRTSEDIDRSLAAFLVLGVLLGLWLLCH